MKRITTAFFTGLALLQLGFIDSIRSDVAKGNELYAEGKFTEALEAYSEAELEAPRSPELYLNIGNALYEQRKYEDAKEMYSQAYQLGGDEYELQSLYNIASSLYREGKLPESLEAFKSILTQYPDDEDTKYNVEFIEIKMKEMLNDAEKTMQQQQQQQESNQQEPSEGEESKEEQKQDNSSEPNESEGEASAKPEDSQGDENEQESDSSSASAANEPEEKPADTTEQEDSSSGEKEDESEGEDKEDSTNSEESGDESDKESESEEPEEDSDSQEASAGGAGAEDDREQSEGDEGNSEEMSREEAEKFLDYLDTQMQDAPVNPQQDQAPDYSNYRRNRDW